MSEPSQNAYDEAESRSVALGFVIRVVEADDHVLLIDLDDEPSEAQQRAMGAFLNRRPGSSVMRTVSPGGKTHVYVRLQCPLPEGLRIAYQAVFGSDPLRELASLVSPDGDDPKVVLFERQEEYERVCAFLGRDPRPAPAMDLSLGPF